MNILNMGQQLYVLIACRERLLQRAVWRHECMAAIGDMSAWLPLVGLLDCWPATLELDRCMGSALFEDRLTFQFDNFVTFLNKL